MGSIGAAVQLPEGRAVLLLSRTFAILQHILKQFALISVLETLEIFTGNRMKSEEPMPLAWVLSYLLPGFPRASRTGKLRPAPLFFPAGRFT
jgi:hypothetical protein